MEKKSLKDDTSFGLMGVVFGIQSIVFALVSPLIGIIFSLIALGFVLKQKKADKNSWYNAGLTLCIIGILLNIILAIVAVMWFSKNASLVLP